MYLLKAWTYGLLIVAWLCCSSLLIRAQDTRITNPDEVKALQAIKSRLIDPNRNLRNWDRGDPCTSKWTGIVCYNTTLEDGYLHVDQLELLNMNLSGSLAPELGQLSNLTILDFMWNNISGSIPKEIGNITSLFLLLLNGNQLTGPLPKELGYLPNLNRIQIDQNHISGRLPKSFAFLNKTMHFHMNNNSISGQIPPQLSRLPSLAHFLLDNNNLSGSLPPQFSEMPNLLILQLDNNNFDGTTIPASYGNMSKLLKLDLSTNQLNGTIPQNRLSASITTIDLSNNNLTGTIPTNFSGLPLLQKLSLANNSLNGSVPSAIWDSMTLNAKGNLTVELQNNNLSNITGSTVLPSNVTVWLQGNPLCNGNVNLQFCQPENDTQSLTNSTSVPIPTVCPPSYECSTTSTQSCICAAPLIVEYRLKSPGFTDFRPYIDDFEVYMTEGLNLYLNQLDFKNLWAWEVGPRLKITLKFFPENTSVFNSSEVQRITSNFTSWKIPLSYVFGPYELLGLDLLDVYKSEVGNSPSSGISKGALAGIVVGTIAGAVTLSVIVSLLILRVHMRKHHAVSKRRHVTASRTTMKIDGVKDFTYGEMALATNNFNSSSQVGQGGYGMVYKGILADGTLVAIKRAQEGSLQGEREFLTEIELLSRLHHRNLVSLIGLCDEEGEQMLVYEFMSNGTIRDHLSVKSKEPLSFVMRLKIALESSKGILYLHTEADPPIFHRDIKASNILLDSKYTAKVADFGLSRLAPVPDIEGDLPTHVSTVVKGTPGYLDPEYFLTHKLTDKSDVYSLGVVFLELLTGMYPISHGKNIVREVKVAYQSGMIFSVIDDRMGSYPSECVVKFLTLALKCCEDETYARPSMAKLVRELENIWLLMPDSDIKTTNPMLSGSEKAMTSPSSSSNVMNPFVSSDVPGNDHVSGVVPSIMPR
ncbi:probable LRR receptor-like serine/threonine-protein kinase At1g06840 isoform X3 [Quercus robur]|uniref:probable LRR receptor-like serine/threonine-protein kinase At1g06840 isoform X3 n=1 Tax=Quercus robur TaxID=38942 RepID=UPI0021637D5C|nr:probable LRR receptor-like serine/threonine-protein kinase At1g06840 isoform X3 [Quercus robur]